jgi:hypothetical protein
MSKRGRRGDSGDALSRALVRQRPELAGHVHYVNGRPWCDGINHTTMCDDDFSDERPARRPLGYAEEQADIINATGA